MTSPHSISRKSYTQAIRELSSEFESGELPPQNPRNNPEGEKIPLGELDYRRVWAFIESSATNPRHIWFARDNGGDGDCWLHCNIADGIGYRLPYSEELARRIKALRESLTTLSKRRAKSIQ